MSMYGQITWPNRLRQFSWNSKSSVNHIKIPNSTFPRRFYPRYFMGLEAKNIFLLWFSSYLLFFTKANLSAMADKCREPGRSKRSCEYWVLWPLFAKTWFLFPCSRPLKAPEQSVLLFYHDHLELQKLYYNKDREFSILSRATYPGLFNSQLKFSAKHTFHSCSAYLGVFCLNRKEHTAKTVRSYPAFNPSLDTENIWNAHGINLKWKYFLFPA